MYLLVDLLFVTHLKCHIYTNGLYPPGSVLQLSTVFQGSYVNSFTRNMLLSVPEFKIYRIVVLILGTQQFVFLSHGCSM